MSKLIPLPSRLCKYQPLKLPDSSTHAYKPVHGMNFIWLLRMILLLCPCTVWNCRWASHRTPMSGGVTVAVASSQSQHRQLPLLLLGERHESVYAPSAKSKLKTKSIRASSSGVLSSSQVQDLEPKLEVEEENVTMFKGRNIDLDALFVPRHRVPDVSSFAVSDKDEDDPQEDVFLYFGGCLLQRISPNDSANDTNTQHSKLQMTPTVPLQVLVHQTLVGAHNEGRFGLWDDLLLGPQGAASAPGERPEAAFTVTSSQVYDMLRTEDHRRPYELLVGRRNPLYRPPSGHGRTPFSALDDEPDDKEEAQRQAEISADGNAEVLTRPKPSQPQYVDKQWRTVSMGHLWAITAQQRHMQHYLLISVDRFGQPSVYSHRYAAISDAKPEPAAAPAECTSGEPSTPLRVLTYNLWHHNPPSWVSPYKDPQVRWDRYVQRLHAFAKVILNSNADVVLVQEVRLDNAFNAGMGAPFPEEPPSQSRAASPDAAGMAERDRVAEAAWRRALAAGQPAAPRSSSGPSGSPRGLWELFSHYPRHEFGDANPSNHTTMQGEADAKEWLGSVGPLDAGHQLSHLLAALRAQECWRHKIHPLEAACWAQHAGSASADSPPLLAPWRYVYQPAMNMVEKGAWGARHEEGVAILSRHPMTSVDALILPRELTNPKDDHTRVVLRAKLRVPVTEASNTSHENSCRHGGYKEVLVMTSHFSLHAPSRQEGVSYLLANTVSTSLTLHLLAPTN